MAKKKLILVLVLMVSLLTSVSAKSTSDEKMISNLKEEISRISKEQMKVMIKTFAKGAKKDWSWTLTAIAWEESKFGLAKINFNDPSAGVFHNYLPTVLKNIKVKDTPYNRNIYGGKLADDFNFSFQQALIELERWKKVRKNNWSAVVKSYNKGYLWDKKSRIYKKKYEKDAERYLKRITLKLQVLKWYFKQFNIEELIAKA